MKQNKTQNLKLIGISVLFLTTTVVGLTAGYFSNQKTSYDKTASEQSEQKLTLSNDKITQIKKLKTQIAELIEDVKTKLINLANLSKGATGPIGPAGPVGSKGLDGQQGNKGSNGLVGKKGIEGEIGPAGAKGQTGAEGERGVQGERGAKGERGDRGAKGNAGLSGLQGEGGVNGPAGNDGAVGADGAKGNEGEVGNKGAEGERGAKGERGDPGADGVAGIKGDDGETGSIANIDKLEETTKTLLQTRDLLIKWTAVLSTSSNDADLQDKVLNNVIKPSLKTMYFENWILQNIGKKIKIDSIHNSQKDRNTWWKKTSNLFQNLIAANDYLFKNLNGDSNNQNNYGLFGEVPTGELLLITNVFYLKKYTDLTQGIEYQKWIGFTAEGNKQLSAKFTK